MILVRCDGSPTSVDELARALGAALDGAGPAVLPYAGPAPLPPDADPLGAGPALLPPEADPLGAALLLETSGSTGAAKRVCLPAAALRASAEATHAFLGGPGCWLLALPAHHVAGAQVIVRGLLAGHRPVVLDNRGGFRAERFAAAVDRLPDRRRYTSLVPTQLHRLLAAGGAALDALRTFHGVLIGGAATPSALLTAARSAGVAAVTTYGMSETSGGCVYDGRPLDGVSVSLDETGRISLAGPVLASGYLGLPSLTATAFAGGRFRTSDLGQWTRDGRLRVLGRADDVITTGGEKVHPAAVERVLAAQPGVRAACVVGVADPEWGQLVAAALVAEGTPDLAALAAAVRAELGAPAVPRLLRTLDELPLRGIGKPDRAAVTRLLSETRT